MSKNVDGSENIDSCNINLENDKISAIYEI